MCSTANITPAILTNTGYKVSYFPATVYKQEIHCGKIKYYVFFYPENKEATHFTLRVEKFIEGILGLRDYCTFYNVSSCQVANKILDLFPGCNCTLNTE